MANGRHFRGDEDFSSQQQGRGAGQDRQAGAGASAPTPAPRGYVPSQRPAPRQQMPGQAGPAPRSGAGTSQDTMQFVALASSNKAAGAGARGRRTPPGAGQGADTAGAGAGTGASSFAQGAPRIETERFAPASSQRGEEAEFFDFNLPYGSGDDGSGDDGLVRHRHRRGDKRPPVGAIVAIVLIALVVALGASGFMMFRSVSTVRDKAKTAVALATDIKDSVSSGDFAALPDDAAQIERVCAEIQGEMSSPLWNVASCLPVVGGDVNAARTLVDALSGVSSGALVPIAEDLAGATPGKLFQDGAINVSAIEAVVDSLGGSAEAISDANDQVQAIGDTSIPQVTELVDMAKDSFAMLDGAVETSQKIAPVLPAMLGADGERTYLIVAENNAEIRTLGGFSGASGILSVDNGVVSLEEFEGAQTLRSEGGPTDEIEISDEEWELFQPDGETLNFTAGDAFFVPDFPRGAELTTTIWGIKHDGQEIDGVFALDPVFLQYVLELVGGVTAVDGTEVDGTNAAQALLSDVYWKYPTDSKMQDAVFASVASAAFDKLLGSLGGLDFVQLFDVVGRGASEGRLLVWMANADEEAAIREVGVDGALPTDPSDPETGVYVNNYSYSKLDWYLDLDVECGSAMTDADGNASYSLMVKLTNTMTDEEAADLPAYVQAHNDALEPAEELLRLYLYAPMGGSITGISTGDGELTEATHNDLQVFYTDVHLMPGESYEVTYTVTVPAEGADKELDVRVTPTAQTARDGAE